MAQESNSKTLLIVGAIFAAAVVGLIAMSRTESLRRDAEARAVATAATPAPVETASDAAPHSETRVTFARRMPNGKGTPVISSSGEFHGNAYLVAVPTEFHKIEYLPGSDPRAMTYLAEARAAREDVTFDRGPTNVDPHTVPAKGITSTGKRRVTVSVEQH